MPTVPAATKSSVEQQISAHARARWPALTDVQVRFRGAFAYVQGRLPDGDGLPLCRLRYVGSADQWGFAIYRASHDDYEDNILPPGGSPAPQKKPSTAPAASTSTTQPPGSHHRRINDRSH